MDRQKLMEQVEAKVAAYRPAILEDLKSLVRIPSVSIESGGEEPFGHECARVLSLALDMAEQRGFCVKNHGNWYGTAYFRNEVLCENKALIGIFSHLDVVAAGDSWTYPPFEPTIVGDFIIGRGAGDNKSGAVTGLYTMQILKDLGLPLKSNLMVYFGCNEECGMKDIERFTREHPMPDYSMVPDLFFPVCYGEKGNLKLTLQAKTGFHQITGFRAGKADNVIPAFAEAAVPYEEGLWREACAQAAARNDGRIQVSVSEPSGDEGKEIRIQAKGISGHSAIPAGTLDAIWLLTDFLKDLNTLDADDRAVCAGFAAFSSDYEGTALGIAHEDEPSGKLVCAAVRAGMDGSIPEVLFAIRYPVTDYRERIEADLLNVIRDSRFAVKQTVCNAPLYMEKDSPYIRRLMKVYKEVTGKDNQPFVIDGGTYARKLKNAVGYGGGNGTHAPFLPPGHGRVHQPDEARSISGIMDAIKIYVMSVLEIDEMIWENKQ